MEWNKIYRKNPDIVSREIDNEMILVPVYRTSKDINEMYTLNRTARDIWNMVDGKNTITDINRKMSASYKVDPHRLEEDLKEFIRDMKEIKAIE